MRLTVTRLSISITLLLLAAPLAPRAQQSAMPVIGFLNTQSPALFAHLVAGFHRGLSEAGYVEGRNVAIEYRWAESHNDRLPALAADLVRRQVAVIAATGGSVSALAAKPATATIPIVFVMGDLDPVQAGIVTSLNRPGGNITGVTPFTSVLGPKRLELLRDVVPNAGVIGMLVNPNFQDTKTQVQDVLEAARALGRQIYVLNASSVDDLERAFVTLVQRRIRALLVGNDGFFNAHRAQLVGLAARHAIPAIYSYRDYATAGGLMSYAPSLVDAYRQAGIYTGRILKGAKPAELPVLQPTTFELVINSRTAKALALTVPPSVLVRADEVLE
jgi:putative tryptophan/tyrosine transport system substrate-binding protein